MSETKSTDAAIDGRTERLRASFDRCFREARTTNDVEQIELLTMRVGGELVAVPVDDVAQVKSRPRIVAVPGAPLGCIGVAGHRSKLVGVFDLAALLGMPGSGAMDVLVISRRDPSIAFAAVSIDRYRRVPRSMVRPANDAAERIRIGTLASDPPALVVSLEALVRDLGAKMQGGVP